MLVRFCGGQWTLRITVPTNHDFWNPCPCMGLAYISSGLGCMTYFGQWDKNNGMEAEV